MSAPTRKIAPQGKVFRQFRRKLLVYPSFQLGMVAINSGILLAAFFGVGVQASRSFSALRREGIEANLPLDHSYFHFIQYQESHLYTYLLLGVLLGFAVSLMVTLAYSQRLAGPIVRLKAYLGQVAETGRRLPLEFREEDFFQDLPYLVNEAFDRMEGNRGGQDRKPGGLHVVQDTTEDKHRKKDTA